MNNELDLNHVINRDTLEEDNYFQSLIGQAFENNLLDEHDLNRLQMECLNLLAYKTERFNGGDSSSIRVEKAQEIMDSIFYTIGLWLKTYPSPDHAVTALKKKSVKEIYQSGRKHIDTMLVMTKVLHKKLVTKLIDTPNVFYKATLTDGIYGFFKLYCPDYAAQEIHITADYPLYNPIPKLKGIEFINAYVKGAFCENLFCDFFPADDINHLLRGYEKNYQELLFNLYEQVLTAALGCMVAGTEPRHLDITPQGICSIEMIFDKKTDEESLSTIEVAAVGLKESLQLPEGVYRYIQCSLPVIAGKINTAVCDKSLSGVFYLPAYPENDPKILFSYNEKMDDEGYRHLIDEIRDCRFSDDKITLIKKKIHSLADLDDMLSDAELTDEETEAVLMTLTLPEIAALSKKHELYTDADESDLRDGEIIVRRQLQKFISKMMPKQQKMLEKAVAMLEDQ